MKKIYGGIYPKTKIKLLGQLKQNKTTAHGPRHTKHIVVHRGGNIMLLECSILEDTGKLVRVVGKSVKTKHRTRNPGGSCKILETGMEVHLPARQ